GSRSPRTTPRKAPPPIRIGSTGFMTVLSGKRQRTNARWRWSISSAGWRRGANRSAPIISPCVIFLEKPPPNFWDAVLSRLDIEIDVNRYVVGRLVPRPHMAVDAGIDQPVGGVRREQQVIDADAVVLGPGSGLVVPERVEIAGIAGCTDGVSKTQIDQCPELLSGWGQKQRIVRPSLGTPGIGGGRNDIEIAGQQHRLFQFQSLT